MFDQFVIAPHHPDRLARPPARDGALVEHRFHQTLTWNVFRTLELLAPSFWLRRLHARLTGDPAVAAAQVLRVGLWQPLPLPPIQKIDGARADIVADVVIETEHTVWTLLVASSVDGEEDDRRVTQMVDAGSWLAGARQHCCGVIDTAIAGTSIGDVMRRRYGRSRDSLELRSSSRGPSTPRTTTVGAMQWSDLAAILNDGREAASLSAIERALAHNACVWLQTVGVRAAG